METRIALVFQQIPSALLKANSYLNKIYFHPSKCHIDFSLVLSTRIDLDIIFFN